MKQLFYLLLCAPLLANAQEQSAIKWTQGLSWQQVKERAKKENKYIFVDAFTTWCKPCREMDVKVYTVDSLGDFMNKEFISVKVQMDQTKNDDAATKSWYKTASYMAKEFHIDAYPSMLFFTPSGEVATKELGFKDAGTLITAAKNSKDPSKQYYVLLKNYKKGNLDDAAKRALINMAKQLGDTANYHALRTSYFTYLHALPKEKLYTKENVEFIASIISRRSQQVFDMFYPDGSVVDKVMQKIGYAKGVVDDVIMKEKIAPVYNAAVKTKQEPNWSLIFNSIAKDYNGEYADRNVLQAKITWYQSLGDFVKLAPVLSDKIEKYGTDTTSLGQDFILNNYGNWIWEHVGTTRELNKADIKELGRAAKWMEGVVRRGERDTTYYHTDYWPLYLDTYANLLYKSGNTVEAIKWEELAASVSKSKEFNISKGDRELLAGNLEMMRKGEPNWPVEEKK